MGWVASTWTVFLTLAMGIGAAIVTHIMLRYYGVGKAPRKMREWHAEVERRMLTAVQADLYAAEARAALAEMIGQLPSDFDATILLAVNIGSSFQRAAIYEAERQELVPRGTFSRLYGIDFEGEAARIAAMNAQPEQAAELQRAAVPTAEPSGKWIGSHRVEGQ